MPELQSQYQKDTFPRNARIVMSNKQNTSGERNLAKTEKTQKKRKKAETTDTEAYLKQLPPPPEEHAHELKMEKRLKRMLKEQEKKKEKKTRS